MAVLMWHLDQRSVSAHMLQWTYTHWQHAYETLMSCCLVCKDSLLWLQVDRGSIWCFEQEQSLGGSNVSTNVRMTVIKLKSGGLFVHAPIAATR